MKRSQEKAQETGIDAETRSFTHSEISQKHESGGHKIYM